MAFKDRKLNFMTFQALKMKFLNSMTFHVFYDLYQPCNILTECKKGWHRGLVIRNES